ncbi:transposable element Tcb1 transposase [Trichonephila clavipes]|nr:transposable element Tcb1 transposase [Trichonephila clavipes]
MTTDPVDDERDENKNNINKESSKGPSKVEAFPAVRFHILHGSLSVIRAIAYPNGVQCHLIRINDERYISGNYIKEQSGQELDEHRPSAELTEAEKIALLGKPRLGDNYKIQLRIKESKEFKDEVETLAYQLNEEAERTERPIRRLSKVMYGSTCADMQVDVMGECLISIKHVVGTTSGCFYPRSNHWEVGGRPQCDKCGCRVRNCSQHRFTTLETISNYRNSYPGLSSGRPRGTTPADDRYIVLQARRNRRQTAGEIARHTTQATGRPVSRFTVARRLHGGGLFARLPVRCVPLTPAHRRRRSLWCREHRN